MRLKVLFQRCNLIFRSLELVVSTSTTQIKDKHGSLGYLIEFSTYLVHTDYDQFIKTALVISF